MSLLISSVYNNPMTLLTEPTRIVLAKGQPVPNDPNFAFNSLLLHGDGANGSTTITDNSPSPKTVTAVGNAQISTAQSKFGGASIALDGSGDYLTISANPAFSLNGATENFTIEFWSYYTGPSVITNAQFIGTFSPTAAVATGWGVCVNNGQYRWFNGLLSTSIENPLVSNAWVHLAIVCSSAAIKMYVNGVQGGTTQVSNLSYVNSAPLAVGSYNNIAIQGYIDDLRITKGVARYTANFTPPTAPFPDF